MSDQMSAWSDYQCGAITEIEYRLECLQEARMDEMYEEEDEEEDEDD